MATSRTPGSTFMALLAAPGQRFAAADQSDADHVTAGGMDAADQRQPGDGRRACSSRHRSLQEITGEGTVCFCSVIGRLLGWAGFCWRDGKACSSDVEPFTILVSIVADVAELSTFL